ncbi:unnamed protein product [Amoebophrya sp. A120]|nr:unnamed protein product [Amoebophrya sp. A120]|eukprot:GSA120T00024823001.1
MSAQALAPAAGRNPAAGDSRLHAGREEPARERRRVRVLKSLRVGTFNVRTLGVQEDDGTRTVERECLLRDARERKLDVLATQESRVTEWINGEKLDEYVLYGGGAWKNAAGAAVGGVLFLIRSSLEVVGYEDEQWGRHARISLRTPQGQRVHVHGCYAPTNAADRETKDLFWNRVAQKVAAHSSRDVVVAVGDFNAEFTGGPQWELIEAGLPFTVGPCGLTSKFAHESDNATRLQSFAAEAELVDVSSMCKKPWSRRFTFQGEWKGARNKREYDHILISWKHRARAHGFRVHGDTNTFSDHRLVVVEIAMWIAKKEKAPTTGAAWVRTKQAAEQVSRELEKVYNIEATPHAIETGDRSTDQWWGEFEEVLVATIDKLSRKAATKKGPRKPWISTATWEKIEERKRLMTKEGRTNKLRRSRLGRVIRMCIKEDKKAWVVDKLEELRRADNAGNSREVFEVVRQLAGKSRKPAQELPGSPEIWTSFWGQILGEPRPEPPEETKSTKSYAKCTEALAEDDKPAWCHGLEGVPSESEVVEALRGLKAGKAYAGAAPAELIRDCALARAVVVSLVRRVFRGEEVPEAWGRAVLAMLHKKGDKSQAKNYRPIALLTFGEKLLGLIILKRIEKEAAATIDKRQKGCTRGLSCRHGVFQILRDMEKCKREGRRAYLIFADFLKAFDSLGWDVMHKILKHQGLPEYIGRVVRSMYDSNAKICIRLARDRWTKDIKQRAGIRQGSSLSPLIFAIVLDFAITQFARVMEAEKKWSLAQARGMAMSLLGFVDDLVVKANDEEDAQFAVRELAGACRFVGLELNPDKGKTEVMVVNQQSRERKNEFAMTERCMISEEEGVKAVHGFLVEWDGIDLVREYRAAAAAVSTKLMGDLVPTHLAVWDNGLLNIIKMKASGWATLDNGRAMRITRLGRREYILEKHNQHRCPRCGDVLEDATALKYHLATGFCRKDKTIQEQRTLRVARQVEGKKKSEKAAAVAEPVHVWHGGKQIATVERFVYLGTEIDRNATTTSETKRRCAMALSTVKSLTKIWRDKEVPKHLKAGLYRALSLSVALYNAETWATSEEDEKILRSFQTQALRHILGYWDWQGAPSRDQMCRMLGVQAIEVELREKRISWIAHTARDTTGEGSLSRVRTEIQEKTPWGRKAAEDLEFYNFSLDDLVAQKPTGAATRETLTRRRPYATGRREQKKKGPERGKRSKKAEKMLEERRLRLEQQKAEQAEAAAALVEKLSGKKWRASTSRPGQWEVEGDPEVAFEVSDVYFCENSGKEEMNVAGVWFVRENDGTFVLR